jgi:hypothetical protein
MVHWLGEFCRRGEERYADVLLSPGRFHASLVIKLILSYLLRHYEMRMEDEKAQTKWYWETFTMPYRSTRILVKERQAN